MKEEFGLSQMTQPLGARMGVNRVCLKYESMMCGLFAAAECEDGKKNEVKIRERAFSEHRSESKRRERGGEKEREAK